MKRDQAVVNTSLVTEKATVGMSETGRGFGGRRVGLLPEVGKDERGLLWKQDLWRGLGKKGVGMLFFVSSVREISCAMSCSAFRVIVVVHFGLDDVVVLRIVWYLPLRCVMTVIWR